MGKPDPNMVYWLKDASRRPGLEASRLRQHPKLHWIKPALDAFYRQGLVSDILEQVKSGKEATVYCCRGHESAEIDLVAAKVYRPRKSRAMRNYSMYQEGRDTLGMGGKGQRDRRLARAMQKRSKLGRKVETESWLQHEYQAMRHMMNICCNTEIIALDVQ